MNRQFNILRQVARGNSYQEVAALYDMDPEEVVKIFLTHAKEFYGNDQLDPQMLILVQVDEVIRTVFDTIHNTNIEERYIGNIIKNAVDALKLKSQILGLVGEGEKKSDMDSFFKKAHVAIIEQKGMYKDDDGIGNSGSPETG